MSDEKNVDRRDFSQGVPVSEIADGGMLLGQVAGEAVLLAPR